MNLTQGALFRHFPTKDALWQSVMEWVAVRLLRLFPDAVPGEEARAVLGELLTADKIAAEVAFFPPVTGG